ncbi:MAG: type VI secretion system tip protein VgrG, partial [Cryobacterium sp.]|nr:type VI secretion system tip protein VgrG [Cryobacterium sp.]
DSNGQLRSQLASSQFATQLNLGHLIHQADNHRGSFRGTGFELRTDAYGTVRGSRGVLLSSYGITPTEPSGDNAGGIALAGQLKTLTGTLSGAARTHQTVALAASIGSVKATQSVLSDKESPAPAMHTAHRGMVATETLDAATADAQGKAVTAGDDKVPQLTDPIVTIAAKAGLAIAAGQDVALLAGENLVMAAGQDLQVASGGSGRVHSGQAIGVLGGAIGAGDQAAGKGLTLIAGQGDVELQAQADRVQVAAKGDVQIQSKSSHIDWAAAKKITLATAGGASIVIEGGNITVECPGKITVRAGTKSFVGPEKQATQLPELPRHTMRFDEKFQLVDESGDPLKNMRVEITKADGSSMQFVTDERGMIPVRQGFSPERLKIRVVGRVRSGTTP